ncbi:hypothetical protein JCM11641_002970 [Rhodosporidiobolus odoratus]
MGQLCGREDHFDRLGTKGNVLGSSASPPADTASAAPPSTPATASAGYSVTSKGKSAGSTSPPQRLGGGEAPGPETDARREAMLKAAEARGKAANIRGTPGGGGKLASQLAAQTKDGGRAAEARMEAERRGEQLVWD